MPKQLIGITGPSTFSAPLMRAAENLLDVNFVLLYQDNKNHLSEWIERIDGIIFAGGSDIHPTCYGKNVTSGSNFSNFDLARDKREIFLLEKSFERKIPIMGICRGHQLIGLVHGMILLPDISGSSVCHSPSKHGITIDADEPTHALKLLKKNYDGFKNDYVLEEKDYRQEFKFLANDNERIHWINSFHHQALYHVPTKKDPPKEEAEEQAQEVEKVRVLGISLLDSEKPKYIVEFMDGENWLSVQWHPENDWEYNPISKCVFQRFKKLVNVFSKKG